MNDFSDIALCGRIAYVIMCAERYALKKFPNDFIGKLFKERIKRWKKKVKN